MLTLGNFLLKPSGHTASDDKMDVWKDVLDFHSQMQILG